MQHNSDLLALSSAGAAFPTLPHVGIAQVVGMALCAAASCAGQGPAL